MPRQVGQRAQAEPLRGAARHRDGVAVVEADRRAHPEPFRRERVHLVLGQRPRALEHHFLDRPGVLGIDVDAPRAKRAQSTISVPPRFRRCSTRSMPSARRTAASASPRIQDSANAFDPTATRDSAAAGAAIARRRTARAGAITTPRPAPRREERGDERVGGAVEQVAEAPALDDASAAHQRDLVADRGRLADVVRDEEHRLVQPLEDGAQVPLEVGADHRIERGERLVEEGTWGRA